MIFSNLFSNQYDKYKKNRQRMNLVAKNGVSNYITSATNNQMSQDEFLEQMELLINYFDPEYLNKLNYSVHKYENVTNYSTLKNYLRNNANWKNYTQSLKPFEFDNLAEAIFKFSVIKLEPDIDLSLIPDYRE